jgi:hemerythrin superfamily protein
VRDRGLVRPWHGSRFCLRSGRVLDGPSTAPQPRYRTRVRAGVVEVARVPEPRDEALTPQEIGEARRGPPPDPPPGARKADEVLFEHHQLLRGLFEEIRGMEREDPERRDILRLLANELEIHEHIEEEIFYPAVRPVSEDVLVAHAEHQLLADMLAATLRLTTSTPEFEERLRALHEAVDHHASSEERSMFREAQRLGDARLRDLGGQLEAMLETERESRARRAYRDLKIRILVSGEDGDHPAIGEADDGDCIRPHHGVPREKLQPGKGVSHHHSRSDTESPPHVAVSGRIACPEGIHHV